MGLLVDTIKRGASVILTMSESVRWLLIVEIAVMVKIFGRGLELESKWKQLRKLLKNKIYQSPAPYHVHIRPVNNQLCSI